MQFHLKYFVVSTIMFSLAAVSMLSLAYAQYGDVPDIPQMKEISGNYVNDDAGVRITFPSTWSGIQMETSQGTLVTVAPGGMSSGQPSQVMNLIISDKTKVKEAPSDPTQGKSQCDTPSVKSISVSGSDGTETIMTCTDDSGKKSKIKVVSAQTEERWISVMFMAPILEFDGSVSKFDDAVKTLSILNVMASENPTPEDTASKAVLESSTMKVMVGGKSVDVPVKSSSLVTNLTVGEENKTVSFSASGNSHGTTSIALGNVLKGPYAVMVDDQVTQDYNMTDAQTLELSYSSGIHNVSISGTQVVPEFPVAVVGIIAAVVGMVAIIGRTKLFGSLKY